MNKTKDYIGHSKIGLSQAIQNALNQAGEYSRCKVVETIGIQNKANQRNYRVTLTTFSE